ncbi:angiopoietin-related protein 3-like isoform X2 [Drosophila innubila]|uniref:angiopoietin-related protein 3-like isoform X2 n=1 Tax=Drosophila innubila TaxID=198719 RepID=UPI00148CC3C3|nr:angiopoietin-related protein 3-like isoform X2 [Drosophila innubila]
MNNNDRNIQWDDDNESFVTCDDYSCVRDLKQIMDVKDKLSEIEIKLSDYSQKALADQETYIDRIASYKETIKFQNEHPKAKFDDFKTQEKDGLLNKMIKTKDELIDALKETIDLLKCNKVLNDNLNLSMKAKIDKLMEEQTAANENKLKKDDEIVQLKSKVLSDEIKLKENIALINDIQSQLKSLEYNTKKTEQMNANLSLQVIEKESELKDKNKKLEQWENEILITIPNGTINKLMHVPGLEPFEPVLADTIAGPGWIVIQRRFDHSVDFDRSFADYQHGFGDTKGEFWLGLEKIHRITIQKQHELLVNKILHNGENFWERYDNFVLGSEEEGYQIKSLGKHNEQFNPFRMELRRPFPIGTVFNNGWWLSEDGGDFSNLNSYKFFRKYSNHKVCSLVKSVEMLIFPK